MIDTGDLIQSLSHDLAPVRRLRPPLWRLASWVAIALTATVVVAVVLGPRPDLVQRLADFDFVFPALAALATALVAAWAALAAGVPGTPGWVLWLPVAPFALWLAALGRQCWLEWLRFADSGFAFNPEFGCFGAIVVVGAVPALTLIVMIGRGARFHATAAVAWGALAVALFANAAHLMFHEGDAGILGVMVQAVSVALILAGALALRRRLIAEAGA